MALGGGRFLKEGLEAGAAKSVAAAATLPRTFSPRTGLPPLSGVDEN